MDREKPADTRDATPKLLETQRIAEAVTICVTHFDRPRHLERCLASIRERFPTVRVIVGDNSLEDRPTVRDDVELLLAEPDCGLSSLRNQLVAAASTPFVMICEEDFVFTNETRVEDLLEVLEADNRVGIAGGSLWMNRKLHPWACEITSGGDGRRYFHDKVGPYNVTAAGVLWQRCDVVLNFFLGRREILRSNPWREEIKIGDEHYTWFFDLHDRRACDVVHVPSVRAIHDRSDRSPHYLAYRQRREWHKLGRNIVQNHGQGVFKPSSIVCLGVGHTGSSIVARMLTALGWQINSNDPAFFEDRRAREVNAAIILGRRADPMRVLEQLSPGWLIKDPRMVVTLPAWLEALARTAPRFGAPFLLYLQRDAEQVLESYRRRGESVEEFHPGYSVSELLDLAERRFQEWPWPKARVTYESLAKAVELWKPNGAEACIHRGEQLGEVPCGCGSVSKTLPVYKCSQFGQCTERASGKPQRWNGEKIAACSACELNPQFARRSSGA